MKRSANGIRLTMFAAVVAGFAGPSLGADPAGWSYTGANGPAKWGKLSKDFVHCGTGAMQSPIDIPDKDVRKGDLPALLFNYKPSQLRIVDDGRTLQINYAPGSWLSVAGKLYELVAITLHKPSEEKINGRGQEMSAHFIHKDKDGKVMILAELLDQGAENPLIKALWSNLPPAKGKEHAVDAVTINAFALLPQTKGYYMYTGSLTTPPCTENVTWYVLKTPGTVSADQVARFGRLYPASARPIQARNDRDIVGTP